MTEQCSADLETVGATAIAATVPDPKVFDPVVKAGGELRLRQAAANLDLTLFAALAMSAATASGFET